MFHLAETNNLAYVSAGCWASQGLGALVFPSASNRFHEQISFLPPHRLSCPSVAAIDLAAPLVAWKDAPCNGFLRHPPAKFFPCGPSARSPIYERLEPLEEPCTSRALPGHRNASTSENLST